MLNRNAKSFIAAAEEIFGTDAILSRDDINRVVNEKSLPQPYWLFNKADYRVGRGIYKLPSINSKPKVNTPEPMTIDMSAQVLALRQPKLVDESDAAIPQKFKDYVPFGFFKDMRSIVQSKSFYPIFVTGQSGNGKTLMVEQVCAELGRECIRVNISIETDESDLLGGPTLINGSIVNRDGPVLIAMKRGAVLLIDEVDRGSNKLMCLQGILEGKPYYNKKSGENVYPTPGFNIIATANTKGMGADEGKYLAQILDSAFLERFPILSNKSFQIPRQRKSFSRLLLKIKNSLITWSNGLMLFEKATKKVLWTRLFPLADWCILQRLMPFLVIG